ESFSGAGTLSLGGSASGNYTLGGITGNGSAVTIGQASLTLTAVSDTKVYDKTTTASATPTVSGLQTGDTVSGLAESYDTANAGTGKTLSVTGYTVDDGHSGANYSIHLVSNTTGAIDPRVVLLSGARTYDGTPDADASILTIDNNLDGTNLSLTGSGVLASKNAGSESFSGAGTLSLGGSASGNYTLGGITGNGSAVTIGQASLTLTAVSDTKVYDKTTTASATPTVSGLQFGDSLIGLAESYDTASAGTGKTLSVTGYTVNDGNSGGNYSVHLVSNTTGVIEPAFTSQEILESSLECDPKYGDRYNYNPSGNLAMKRSELIAVPMEKPMSLNILSGGVNIRE
ncbi:MAG TPA: YDG domain-containing protein, partial [Chlorobaculum sp.]|nr:YDG domain-containing protein [Chlorobaculum sp.]